MRSDKGLFPSLPVDAAAKRRFETELPSLLIERAKRYTMGDAESLPTGVAQRLADGILYPVSLICRENPVLSGLPLSELRERGVGAIRRLATRGKLLYKQALGSVPKIPNRALTETLAEIGAFFRNYDPDFFGQEIPCSIDYPLAEPIPESMLGIEYVNAWLRALLAENAFLNRLPDEKLSAFLFALCRYDEDLVLNLAAPAAEAVLGAVLSGNAPSSLLRTESERGELLKVLSPLTPDERLRLIEHAADTALSALGITETEYAYFGKTMLRLLPRLDAAIIAGDLSGIFPG